jgi:hypothetical protein
MRQLFGASFLVLQESQVVSAVEQQNTEDCQADEVQPLTHEQQLKQASELNDSIEQSNQRIAHTLDQVEQMIEELERSL